MSGQRQRTINRRQLVAGTAGGGLALALGAQLTGAQASTRYAMPGLLRAQGAANIPTPREETLIIEQTPNNIWDSFNPFIPNGEAYAYGLTPVCRENMFYVNFLTGETTPWLATKYSYNADFTECTLKLNPAARWSDGQPFTAEDVVFSQTLLLENAQLNGAQDTINDVKSVKASDANTVVWTLTSSQPRFHYRFLAGIIADGLRIVPKHIWEGKNPGSYTFSSPVYTGPYTLQESSSTKLYYLWKKNENYWNKAAMDPKPGYVLYIQQTSPDASVQDFLAGNVDVPMMDALNQQVVASQYQNVAQTQFADPCPRGIFFNSESPSGLLATPKGRWAMSHLLDRETIANTISQPPSRAATFPWADYQGWKTWAPESVMSKYDLTYSLDKANQLLDQLGATRNGDLRSLNGKPLQLSMICPASTNDPVFQIGQTFAAAAKEVGIRIDHKSLPGSAWGDVWDVGDFDISNHWICGMQFDPNQLYRQFSSDFYQPIGSRANQGDQTRTKIAELDAVIKAMDQTNPDEPGAKDVFDHGLDVFMENLPCVASAQNLTAMTFNTTYWSGWPTGDLPQTIPANWWGQFLFTVGNLRKA